MRLALNTFMGYCYHRKGVRYLISLSLIVILVDDLILILNVGMLCVLSTSLQVSPQFIR